MSDEQGEHLFDDISPEQNFVEIESLCMQCQEKGVSRFLLTRIPHFRDIVVAAFECPHCGHRNNEVQSVSSIAEKGVKQTCHVGSLEDLNRQVVVSEHASIYIDEIELEVPAGHDKGYLNTIEGILRSISVDLHNAQQDKRISDEEARLKLDGIISKLDEMIAGKSGFTFILDDPSGNSYIENPLAPQPDPNLKSHTYAQTPEQLAAMGVFGSDSQEQDAPTAPESIYCFPTNCAECSNPCEARMHMVQIPHFREVIIMATTCDKCGYRTNEVRSGGAISEKGKRIILRMTGEDDLSRDVLKSETCAIEIPELGLQLSTNALGGRFTTLEGLLRQVHDEVRDKTPFIVGDSASDTSRSRLDELLENIQRVYELDLIPVTIVLDDPLGNSYLQNLCAPDDDPAIKVEEYERTFEQNEEFGLNDIKVEGYSA